MPNDFAAPESDPAGRAARLIAERVRSRQFLNYRAGVRGATWVVDPQATWQVRGTEDCLKALERLGVPFTPIRIASPIVPAPVRITAPIEGVDFGRARVSCELAHRMRDLALILRRHMIVAARVMSDYRTEPFTSYHTMGLALDLSHFTLNDGTRLSVEADFLMTPSKETCEAELPLNRKARILLEVACEIHGSRGWQTVLTPNYNPGHRDHFHIDIRPDDPRLFLR
jgi:hypothetical protein